VAYLHHHHHQLLPLPLLRPPQDKRHGKMEKTLRLLPLRLSLRKREGLETPEQRINRAIHRGIVCYNEKHFLIVQNRLVKETDLF
jgi:hypothetical protein